MAHTRVTVNGRSVDVWIEEEEGREKSEEIRSFLRSEMQGFRRTCRRPIVSAAPIRNTTKVVAAGNNSIRFE